MLTINTLPSETETFIDAINIIYLFPHSLIRLDFELALSFHPLSDKFS